MSFSSFLMDVRNDERWLMLCVRRLVFWRARFLACGVFAKLNIHGNACFRPEVACAMVEQYYNCAPIWPAVAGNPGCIERRRNIVNFASKVKQKQGFRRSRTLITPL